MRCFLTLLMVMFISHKASSQDMLYQKTGNVIRCKICEVTPELIKYRADIPNSPVYEIKKEAVVQIRFRNRIMDKSNPDFQKVFRDSTLNILDTVGYATIYIVFDPGETTQIFPVYIDGKYICTLRHHSRLAYRIISEGKTEVCRISNKITGPSRMLNIRHGCIYAIAIGLYDEQITDPGQRFYMTVFEEQNAVRGFIEQYYQGFEPYKSDDYQILQK